MAVVTNSESLPTLRADLRGYVLDGEAVEGFADREELSVEARTVIARLARAYAPDEVSSPQEELLATVEDDRSDGVDLLQALADDEWDIEAAFMAGFYDELSDEKLALVREPWRHSSLEGRSYPLKIGEVVKLTTATERQLRHWEENGLLPVYYINGQRRYFRGGVVRAMVLADAPVYEVAALSSLIRKGAERFVRLAAVVLAGNPDYERVKSAARELTSAGAYLDGLTAERPTATRSSAKRPRPKARTPRPRALATTSRVGTAGASARAVSKKESGYVIAPRPAGGWQVVKEGGKRASAQARSKSEAVARGREIAAKRGGGELLIHERSGTVKRERVPAERRATVANIRS
jgi:hypothetical protein